jgi:hypothetical protein
MKIVIEAWRMQQMEMLNNNKHEGFFEGWSNNAIAKEHTDYSSQYNIEVQGPRCAVESLESIDQIANGTTRLSYQFYSNIDLCIGR